MSHFLLTISIIFSLFILLWGITRVRRKVGFLSTLLLMSGTGFMVFIGVMNCPYLQKGKADYKNVIRSLPKASLCELTKQDNRDGTATFMSFVRQVVRGNPDSLPGMHKETCHRASYKIGDKVPPLECTVEEQTIERYIPDGDDRATVIIDQEAAKLKEAMQSIKDNKLPEAAPSSGEPAEIEVSPSK